MIHISYKSKKPPFDLTNLTAKNQIDKAFNNRDGNKCTNYSKVYEKLKAISLDKNSADEIESGKCFYCESKTEHAVKLQIEHYRPKAGLDKKDNSGIAGKGYYWLCNEWTNLLLACSACNGKSAKGTRFPIAGTRATAYNPIKNKKLYRKKCIATNSPLKDETPLLLNPEIDFPENFLTFDIDGQIKEIPDANNRGKTTILILKLDRGILFKQRQSVLNNHIDELDIIYVSLLSFGMPDETLTLFLTFRCKKIKKSQNPDEAFSLWGKYINDNFLTLIANRYSGIFKHHLINCYNSV